MKFADYLTDIADILASSADNGEIRVNLGDVASGDGFDADVPMYGPDGYIARPNDPDGDGAAFAFWAHDGHQRRVLGTKDNRFATEAGTMQPGDRRIVTNGPTKWFLTRAKAQIGNYTEAAQDFPVGGKGMIEMLDGDAGIFRVQVGGCIAIADGSSWKFVAAGPTSQSTIVMTDTSITLTASTIYIDGGNVTVGATGGVLRPGTPGVDSAIYGSMGQAGIASSCVFIAK